MQLIESKHPILEMLSSCMPTIVVYVADIVEIVKSKDEPQSEFRRNILQAWSVLDWTSVIGMIVFNKVRAKGKSIFIFISDQYFYKILSNNGNL